jgi:hypothetical protein
VSTAARTTLRRGLTAALALGALACAAPAQAQRPTGSFATGIAVDGPSADVRAVGEVDVARDGGGAVSYLRRDGGEDHAFVSLVDAGVAQPGVRVDPGLGAVIARPAVAASDGGRVVAVFATAAGVFASVRPDGSQPFGAPQPLGGPGATDPVVDLAATGVAYAAWTENGDVRAAYLPRREASFRGYAGPADADPAREAGTGPSRRPRVAVSADGTGIVVWGEPGPDGLTRVFARRLVRDRLSVVASDATLSALDGRAARAADSPDVGFEDDSSFAWVAFRQTLDDGAGGVVVRAVARRLRGSGFDDPFAIDGAPPNGAVGPPRVGVNGRGQGILTVETPGGTVVASVVRDDVPTPVTALGVPSGVPALPVAAAAENFDGIVAWNRAPAPGSAEVRARTLEDDPALPVAPPFGADAVLSDPTFGPVDTAAGLEADVDRAGDAVVAFVQGTAAERRLVVAAYDRAPGAPIGTSTTNWRRSATPTLAWSPAFDVWSGGMSYQVLLDGQPLGTTGATSLVPPLPIPDGTHTWQVIATDRRGQVARSATRNLRIDVSPPELVVRTSGVRRVGKLLKIFVRSYEERPPLGSGHRRLRLDPGDGALPRTAKREAATFRYVYPRKGTFMLRVSATDAAGNVVLVERPITIKAEKKPKRKKSERERR